MLSHIGLFLQQFFEKNLFERLIIYIFLSILITKIIFELILGQGSFTQSQNQQWIFYGLLGLDYLISFRKVINIRITINPLSLFSFFLFIIVAHGIFIGIMNHNPSFVILNDTIPPLMIALNVLRMQSITENSKPINFRFLFLTCISLSITTCFFGYLANAPSVGSVRIFFPLIFAALIFMRPFPKWTLPAIAIMLLLTVEDMNRTTLFFIALIVSGYIGINTIYNPAKSIIMLLFILIFSVISWNLLPEDSKTYQRIIGLTEIDLSERTGSIGERQAEQDAVALKLERAGTTSQWLGMGFGALYEVKFTHEYIKDYGHAHYAWVWFNLRYGKIGYLYMMILASALLYNGLRTGLENFNKKSETGLFISFLCLLGLIYLFTHVNSIFLLSGIHFLYLPKQKEPT